MTSWMQFDTIVIHPDVNVFYVLRYMFVLRVLKRFKTEKM